MKRARDWDIVGFLSLAILGAYGLMTKGEPEPAGAPLRAPSDRADPPDSKPAAATAAADAPEAGSLGRHAKTPSEIPAKGWWQIAKRVFSQISEDRVLANAAGVTFYALLAIFPAIATLVSLYGLVADPKTIADNLSLMSGFLPDGGMQILHDQVTSLTSGPAKALGLGVVAGLLTSMWSSNAAMKALFDALNVVYDEKEKRSFIWLNLQTLSFTLGGILFVIIAMSGVVVLPAILSFVGLGDTVTVLLKLARWPAMLIILSLFLAGVYRYGPSRGKARWRWVTWGGAAATLFWLLVSVAFSYYVQNFGNYNKTYGSLGAAIGFMTWIWLSTTVVLVGAELNAEMEHQTAHDTTEGPVRPLGQRDAALANQVATG